MFSPEMITSNLAILAISAFIVVAAILLGWKEDRDAAKERAHDTLRDRLAS
jgi:hypothetical protein